MGFSVTAHEVNEFGKYVKGQAEGDLRLIKDTLIREGCSTEGFTGILGMLTGLLEGFQHQVGASLDDTLGKLHSTGDGICSAAKRYGDTDEHAQQNVNRSKPN